MKKMLLLFICLAPLLSKADLAKRVFVKLEFLMDDQSKITVHTVLVPSLFHKDSIIKKDYWKKTLIWKTHFFKDWVVFKHKIPNIASEDLPVITLISEHFVDIDKVKAISLLRQLEGNQAFNIENTVYHQDSVWYQHSPLRVEQFRGYLCDFYIFVFEESEAISNKISQLRALSDHVDLKKEDQMLTIIKSQRNIKWIAISYCAN